MKIFFGTSFFKKLRLFLILPIALVFALSGSEKEETEKAAKALGYLIGQKIKDSPLRLEQGKIMEGLKEALGQKKPSLSETERAEALAKMEEKIYLAAAEKNLLQASLFLQKNAKSPGVVELEKDKLQYKIIRKGAGPSVQSHSTPLVRFKGSLLNGETFFFQEQVIDQKDLMDGLQKALAGMQEKEIRKIFIHPSLGSVQTVLPPNALLIFEVEILKADKSALSQNRPPEIAQEKKLR
ncbi:MAG: FKBP-type peptidyl-prolyl cis-trans isomerase N-terminal domain-containing protein [Parachlamydiales bacterium]|jgi:peptidylprolyl isomerase